MKKHVTKICEPLLGLSSTLQRWERDCDALVLDLEDFKDQVNADRQARLDIEGLLSRRPGTVVCHPMGTEEPLVCAAYS